MGATFLLPVFEITYLVCLAAWVGGISMIRGVVLSSTTTAVSKDQPARWEATAQWLNRYYVWITVSMVIALPAAVARPLSFPELRGPMVAVQAGVILVAIVLAFAAAQQLLTTGRAAGSQQSDDEIDTHFHRALRRTAWMDAVSLLLGVGLLAAFVLKDAPRSPGIIEPTPEQRYETNLQILQEIEGYLLEKKARAERRNRPSPTPTPTPTPSAPPLKSTETPAKPGA